MTNESEQTHYKHVAVFVDYENVYWTLINRHNYNPDVSDVEKNLFDRIWAFYERKNIRQFKAYADFDKVDTALSSLQNKRIQIRNVYSNSKEDERHRKNSADIELSLDAIETTYQNPNIDHFVIVTADRDMIPLISRLMYKGKTVDLFYLEDALEDEEKNITVYATRCFNLYDFLNIEVKEYNPQDYIDKTIQWIHKWHQEARNVDFALGYKIFKQNLEREFQIPLETIDDIRTILEDDGMIKNEKKITSRGEYHGTVLNYDNERVKGLIQELE